jgi:hypothetical protein
VTSSCDGNLSNNVGINSRQKNGSKKDAKTMKCEKDETYGRKAVWKEGWKYEKRTRRNKTGWNAENMMEKKKYERKENFRQSFLSK